MSINKIIVNTTTGADAATSINSTIDLAEAAATLGANEFTGDQLINGTSKQIFPVPQDPNEFTNIAKVTGAVQGGINIDEINFAFAPDGNSIISNSWLLEAYTDSTFTQGSEITLGFNRGRMQVANSIGSQAVMTVLNNPGNNLTTFAAFADNMIIGANAAQTRTVITVGHNALPNLNLRGTLINSTGTINHTGSLNVSNAAGTSTTSGTLNHTGGFTVNSASTNIGLTANQFNVTAPNSNMSGNLNVNQAVDATINTRRLHFVNNPFDSTPPVNLGAIRLFPNNKTLNYTVYDLAGDTENQSYMQQTVDTPTSTATTRIGAYYNDVDAFLQLQNVNGVATLETSVNTTINGNLTVTGTFSAPLTAGHVWVGSTGAVNVEQSLASISGATGPQGATGPAGADGATGLTGATGPNTVVDTTNVFTLNTAINGTATETVDMTGKNVLRVNFTATNQSQFTTLTLNFTGIEDGKMYLVISNKVAGDINFTTQRRDITTFADTANTISNVIAIGGSQSTGTAYATGIGFSNRILFSPGLRAAVSANTVVNVAGGISGTI